MSLTTHRFSSDATLARAQDWLGRVGIPSDHIEVSSTGLPSMTVQTEFTRLPEVEMVINAAELTDPDGWPALDAIGPVRPIQLDAAPPTGVEARSHTAPIGWHSID